MPIEHRSCCALCATPLPSTPALSPEALHLLPLWHFGQLKQQQIEKERNTLKCAKTNKRANKSNQAKGRAVSQGGEVEWVEGGIGGRCVLCCVRCVCGYSSSPNKPIELRPSAQTRRDETRRDEANKRRQQEQQVPSDNNNNNNKSDNNCNLQFYYSCS